MPISAAASHTESESFTDTLQENMSSRDTRRGLIYEKTSLVRPEDPERLPQLSEELERTPLWHGKTRRTPRLDGDRPERRCGWACACGSLGFLLGLAVALLFMFAYMTPVRRHPAPGRESVQNQVLEAVRDTFLRAKHEVGNATSAIGRIRIELDDGKERQRRPVFHTTVITTTTLKPKRPIIDEMQPTGQICNVTAPLPQTSFRVWDVPEVWRRACELKNVQDRFPEERNWCWVGFNTMCHWNLKAHKSWADYQDMAARDGIAPPRKDLPFSPLADPEVCDRPERGRSQAWSTEELAQSRQWFKENIAVYVLSLPTVGDQRWKTIHKRLTDLQIWHTRVPGVDMRAPGMMALAKRLGFMPEPFDFSKAQTVAYSWRHNMGSILGTAGCASAHFKVHQKIIADGAPMGLVLEDDSWLSDDFVPRVWSLVREELPCDWQVTALLSRCGYGRCISPHLMRVMPDANEPSWRCYHGSNWGMHAVLYRTSVLSNLTKRWQRVVFDEERPHCMDVDVALASMSDEVGFYAVPAVQDPGFVREMDGPSARWDINQAFASTTSTTTTALTTTTELPQMEAGDPWPSAWQFQGREETG
mmetsp:Transcript_53277/g.158906  ORF Transcript_53277/g.158906 Transcript_53277/m.158906 type:complete len:590 (-) Transcript_53277:105-1874(-)